MREVIRKIILVLCIAVFCVSAFKIGSYFYTNHKADKEFKELKNHFTIQDLYEKNNDMFGWINVEDTKINYPVMFTPNSPEYYLRKDFYKEYSVNGTPFIDGYTDIEGSSNWIIYGHHIKSGEMFQNLVKYDEEGYWEEHQDITFETINYGNKKYKVFAFGKTDALAEGFNVYNYANVSSKWQFDEYINGLKGLSAYDTGITPQWGDKIITLSTCAYHTEEGRYVVAAVEVSADEEKENVES